MQTKGQPVEEHITYSTISTAPPQSHLTAGSHKTQKHSKRRVHLFLGLGGALVSLNWLMYSNLKTSLDLITPPTCFHEKFFIPHAIVNASQTCYNVTFSFDHVSFSDQIIPISWFLKTLELRFCSFLKFLTPMRFVFADLKHTFLINETQNMRQ